MFRPAHAFYRELDHQHHYKASSTLDPSQHDVIQMLGLNQPSPNLSKVLTSHHIFCLPIYFQYQPRLNMGGAYGKLQY